MRRDVVLKVVEGMFPTMNYAIDMHQLLSRIKPNAALDMPAAGTAARLVANVVVDLAITGGWLADLVKEISRNPGNASELDYINAELASQPAPTVANAHDEVLLEGNRPFVNRRDLRANLRSLIAPAGSTLLLVSGQPQTGKTFSFYLAQHIARQSGFITSQFEVKKTPGPDDLAAEILDRIGANVKLKGRGPESAERWAEKLATQVKDAIEERKLRRVFVFDDFPVEPQPPLPPETYSFIVRMAKYADEELRPQLRVVLIQFTATLPPALDDVAETDEALPFTDADMLVVLKQVRQARNWPVSDAALQTEIQALQKSASLRDRFRFLRKTIQRLGESAPPGAPGGN